MARTLAGLLDMLGWAKWAEKGDVVENDEMPMGVTMLSHSKLVTSLSCDGVWLMPYSGSFAHAWMLKHYPSMVTRSCFVDPVVFCSWEGGT